MFAVPVLLSEIFCEELLPTFTFPKATLVGFAFNTELVATPIPVNAIV